MENLILFSLPEQTPFAERLTDKLNIMLGKAEVRSFPDGETYLRIETDVANKTAVLTCCLDHPDSKILSLLFMAKTIKKLGAKKIILVSPYLPYMRQDQAFHPGEAVTSVLFAQLLSYTVDALITVDPHLHRIKNLSQIYSIPTITLHAAQPIAAWIKNTIRSPFLIGPDEESEQWVSEIARTINAPYIVLKKNRHSDRKVEITMPEMENTDKTPVIIDDIISSGSSMLAVIKQLSSKQFSKPICIVVHALFDKTIYETLIDAGANEIVSCNTISHPSNKIDISDLIVTGITAC